MEQQNQQPNQQPNQTSIDEAKQAKSKRIKIVLLAFSLFIFSSLIPFGADYTGLFCPSTPNTSGLLCLPTPTFQRTQEGFALDYGFGFPFQYAMKQIDVGGYWSGYIWYPQSILANLVFWFLIVALATVIIKRVMPIRTI